MSEQKGFSEKYKSECHESGEFQSVQKDPAHKNKSKSHSKQQKDGTPEDPPNSKDRDPSTVDPVLALSREDIKILLQARRDTKLPIEDIIQAYGLNKQIINSDVLKIVNDRCRKKNRESSRIGNTGGKIQASGNNRKYDTTTNYTNIQNTITNVCTTFGNVNAKGLFLCAQGESGLQDILLFGCFLVAPDGDGDNDPERTKLKIDPTPLERATSGRYLMKLETKREIHTKVLTKEEKFVDICKTVKPSIDWKEKYEENNTDTYTSEEEEGNEALASADHHYCGGEIDDMVDQSVTCGLDDEDVQQFNDTQTVEAEESQDDDENSVANDSSSETQENGGGDMLLEDGVSVQTRLTSGEGVIVEEKSAMHSGNHELAGAGQTIPLDYMLQQSQLVGKQPNQLMYTQSETAGTKHYMLTNGSSITVTENEVITNLAVDSTLQDSLPPASQEQPDYLLPHGDNRLNPEGENYVVEQASELPLTYLSFKQPVLSPTTIQYYHSVYQFPQLEDQSTPLSDEVDTPTEEILEEPYFDAVQAQPEEDSEEIETQPSFVSSPAENVDDESEEVHIERRKPSRWSNCCLL